MSEQTSILVIYTGGTIGMVKDPVTGALMPINFDQIYQYIPILESFPFRIETISFEPIIDSSDMNPDFWIRLASIVEVHYDQYDGFVILHGSDTMAYTASMLSFMLENLNKAVVLTGSQLPLGMLRTDGRENFITAVEIAASKKDELSVVPEVCIYFENRLYRGNRTTKLHAEDFDAFYSGNYPLLAEAGVHLRFNHQQIRKPNFKKLHVYHQLSTDLALLKLYPGITKQAVEALFGIQGLRAVILETFGTGNAPTEPWFLDALRKATDSGVLIYNVTQCKAGSVEAGRYHTSTELVSMGVISGEDITTESAIAKLMYLMGRYTDQDRVRSLLTLSLRGEITPANSRGVNANNDSYR
ncbi:MAG: type I asparaginase [Bacteroidales bacterium]